MTEDWPELLLARIVDGLAQDLAEAPDAEIAEVLAELGQRPELKGSVALFELCGLFGRIVQYRGERDEDDEPPEGGGAAGAAIPPAGRRPASGRQRHES